MKTQVELPPPAFKKNFRPARREKIGRGGPGLGWRIPGALVLSLAMLLSAARGRAEDFGDITVTPNAIYTGSTYHGYAEMRVVLENHSSSKTHAVKLIYPNKDAFGGGNSISRLSRGTVLAPEAREVVTLLQPPLPVRGNNAIRVEVDGSHEGEVRAPNANNHCSDYNRNQQMGAVFISRSLDYDAVSHVFQATAAGTGFTAAKATGSPDATSSGGDPNAWMPDSRSYGRANWLELDYAKPQVVDQVFIRTPRPMAVSPMTTLTLVGISGTNLAKLPMSSGRQSSSSPGWSLNFSLPATAEPVKTVRLDFGTMTAASIAIDAVSISGAGGSQWAADARASSDNSASAARFRPGGSAEEVESLRAESPVSEWSENWLAYSPFDVVTLNAADLRAMSPAVLTALEDYVQVGGNLMLLGQDSLPATWHAAQSKSLHEGKEFVVGFGAVFAFQSENPATLNQQSIQRLREAVRENVRYFQTLPEDSGSANNTLPVVENTKIPTRGIVIMMLAFVIIIGPVNIIYLNRIKRRTWMLWTVPAISIATTLLVFAYSLLREGITPDTRIAGLTVLDQTSHRAATIGGEAFYCPLTPSGGLSFDFITEATPLVSRGYGSGTAREVDWTQSQHLLRGWVASRVPVHFHVRKPETRRERIQVLNENGKLQAVNSLGANIKTLWVADADLNVYQATNLAAGEKGGLTPSAQAHLSNQSGVSGLLTEITFAAHEDPLAENAGKYLLPNTYIAILDRNPFLENALGRSSSPKRTRTSAVVYGLLETSEHTR